MVIVEQTYHDTQAEHVIAGGVSLVEGAENNPRERPPIGELLRKLRGTKTLRQVEADTGITNAYLSNIELGLKRPGVKTLAKVGIYYRVPLDHLLQVAGLAGETPEPAQQESVLDLQRAYEFVLGAPGISRFERPKELPSLDMQKFVIGIYEHYTGRRLL